MKKVTFILASVAMVFFASCKEETEKTTEKTIVVEQPAEVEAVTPPVKVDEESDGTSVNVNKDGVEFSTKDGKKKTEIEVKDGGGNVTIKK